LVRLRWTEEDIIARVETHMTNIVLHSRSGPDGKLRLEVPVNQPDTDFEVEVVVRPQSAVQTLPPGYFDLIGSVDDDTLIVHPQPLLPPPVNVE
jgi:hypothetical protein